MQNFKKTGSREQGAGSSIAGSDPDCGQLSRGLTPFASFRRVLLFIVFLWFAPPSCASYLKPLFPVNVKLESVSVLSANGRKYPMDVPAIEESGFVFVPIRFAALASGAKILWDESKKKAVFIIDGKIVSLTCCGASYSLNGKTKEFPVDIFLVDGRLMVPYKEVMSMLSKPVDSPATSPITSILEPPSVHAETPQDATLVKTKKPLYPPEPGWSSWGFGSFTRKIKKLFYDDLSGNSGNKTMGRLFVACYIMALYLFFTLKSPRTSVPAGKKATDAAAVPSVNVSDSASKEGVDE